MRFSNILILVVGGVNHSIGSNIVRDFKGAGNVNRRENENAGKDKVERRDN
jgi:hypothetical protein